MADPLLNPISGLPGTGAAPQGGPALHASTVSESTFDPKAIVHIIMKRLWLLLAITALVPALVWFYVRKLPKQYQTAASMVIDVITPQVLGQQFRDVVDFENGAWWTAREYTETQFRIIQSRSMALSVAQRLCEVQATDRFSMAKVPALRLIVPGVDCENRKSIERAVPILQGMVSLQPAKDSRVVLLVADGNDPEIVALVANTYVETYIERNLRQRLNASGDAADWLDSEYKSLQKQLTEAEEKLVKFKTDNNIVVMNIEDQQGDVAHKRSRIAEELESTRLKLISLRAVREIYSQAAIDDPMQGLPPLLSENEIIRKLKTQYMEAFEKKVEMAGKYLEKHPLLEAQEARLMAIRDELRREVNLAIKSALSQYDMLTQQEKDLRRALDEATREALALETRAIEYNRLKRTYDSLRKLTETVGGRETESKLAARLRTNNVRMLDAALVPPAPVGPNTRNAILTALAVALVVSVALSFLLEVLDATVKTQEDMERVLRIPFLGMIPHLPEEPLALDGGTDPKDLFIARHPKSTVAECCRVIRTNLLFMSPDRPARTLLVTSAGPQEGKSMSSISLALTMAQPGSRVLLVDTDMRRPRLHKVFGIPSGGVGLTSVIAGTVAPLEAIRHTAQPNLFLLPCGPTPPNPAELLQTERFRQIVTELAGAFDKVIFDSPPIGAVTDALVLSQVTDGVVLVAKSHKTSREMLHRAQRQLRDLSANMLGSILNDLDLENRRKGYGYPYYYYYKSGYYRYGYYSNDGEGEKDAPTQKEREELLAMDPIQSLESDLDSKEETQG